MNNIMDNIVVFIIIQTLLIATPIMITAVGACICELTGVTNIGLEGIMLSGAFAAAVTNISLASVMGPYVGLLVGMLVGGIISLIHAYISIQDAYAFSLDILTSRQLSMCSRSRKWCAPSLTSKIVSAPSSERTVIFLYASVRV